MRIKHTIIAGLTAAIFLDTAGQILWKYAASRLPETTHWAVLVAALPRHPVFFAVGAIFLCQLVNWLLLLKKTDLSYAQPITSLSYISVSVISAVVFGESMGAAKIIGIACVLIGVGLLSQSQPKNSAS